MRIKLSGCVVALIIVLFISSCGKKARTFNVDFYSDEFYD